MQNERNKITKQNRRTERLKRRTHRRSNNNGFIDMIGDFPRINSSESMILISRCKRWLGRNKRQMTLQRRPNLCSGRHRRATVGRSSVTGHYGYGGESKWKRKWKMIGEKLGEKQGFRERKWGLEREKREENEEGREEGREFCFGQMWREET